jgi:hypothetical protein
MGINQGHFRTVCVLAAKIVAERPVIVTLLVPHYQTTFEQSQQEVARCLSDIESPAGIIRYVLTKLMPLSLALTTRVVLQNHCYGKASDRFLRCLRA